MASSGSSPKMLLLIFGGMTALGVYGPRMWLLGRIKRRQKEIWRALPDAFDLITASVEAGLGIDAAFTKVIEKVHGPFAEELARTMREIQMGRSRREAFVDMAARTGVEELRSLVNAIVQAEAMGISIGSVIRIQTGVIRTKRRQRAEEQAFKAPVKMVFPLVFFIFPAIMIVIGGPAVIQIMNNL
jgi:tight adherence protein C